MIDDEDLTVWQNAVENVAPLPESKTVPQVRRQKVFRGEKFETVPLKIIKHDLSLNTSADIDRQTMRRFKREEFKIEGVLDLHGFTENRAFEAVHQFLTNAYLSQKRCVIIITGKGQYHQDQDIFAPKGVLKDRVPQWLQSEDLAPLILSYRHPSERLGGEGALHILLRRKKVV